MYAVIKTGGKQYRVEKGDVIYIEKLDEAADSTVSFDEVIAIGEEGKLTVGTPVVAGAKVEGKILKQGKGKKITVFTYRPKSGQKRKKGHRQQYTKVEITDLKA